MPELLRPDAAIADVLARLGHRFGRGAFDVVEEWDCDLCVVGRAVAPHAPRLVYISTCDCPDGRYGVAFEGDVDDERHGRGCLTALSFDELCAALTDHLGIAPIRT
jgi:hypothetical protein